MKRKQSERRQLVKHLQLMRDLKWTFHGWALVHRGIWSGERPFVVGLFDTRNDAAENADTDEVLVKVEIAVKQVHG